VQPAPAESVSLESIPALLVSLDLPSDEEILAIFEDVVDEDGRVSRQHFLRVAAVLLIAEEEQRNATRPGSEDGDEGGKEDAAEDQGDDYVLEDDDTDDAVAASSGRQTRAQSRRNPKGKGKAVELPSEEEAEEDQPGLRGAKGRHPKMTEDRKAQALATFELFGPAPGPGRGSEKVITLDQLRNVASLLNEKLSDQEVCLPLCVFAIASAN
jgi:hypothetical protein